MNKNQKNNNITTIAIAAIVGGAAGAFVSLMFAPKSGKALRQDIQHKTVGFIDQVENTTYQRAESLKQRSTDLVDKGKKLKEDIQIFIQDLKMKKPGYINITQSVPEETPLNNETETDSLEFTSTEIPLHEEKSTV